MDLKQIKTFTNPSDSEVNLWIENQEVRVLDISSDSILNDRIVTIIYLVKILS